ncbi:MAG TPA: DUF4368 domain-containing protein [Candidatus Copromonas faecavium]|uniref:DUF4368 domain-containing protein n=1 Tax=Candidatus Copromonas faecavium (nom. illeg.) TaxID=2840740 RepID=A0A9D1A4V6_9FIRM|nr:DUF4368 domain-containing protein [Candidatus Copromonas faecavium]
MQFAYDARQWIEVTQECANIAELGAAAFDRLIKDIIVHESTDTDKILFY